MKKVIFHPFRYHGNIVLIVLICLLMLLPLAFVLFIKNGEFVKGNTSYQLAYNGSYGWLIFWSIVFFPLMILLLVIKGIEVIEISKPEEIEGFIISNQ